MFYLKAAGEPKEYVFTVGKDPEIPPGILRERGIYDLVYAGEDLAACLISGSELIPMFHEICLEQHTLRWQLEIEDHAGEISLELVGSSGEILGNWMLDVAPHPQKLGRDAYYELLEDLNNKYEGLIFDVGSAYSNVVPDDGRVPEISTFYLLKTFITPLERAFRAIAEEPQRILVAERANKRLHQVRKFDSVTFRQACREPGMSAILNLNVKLSHNAYVNPLLDTSIRTETFDTAANRNLLETIRRLCRAGQKVEQGFAAMLTSQRYDETAKSRIKRYQTELAKIVSRIERLARASFLEGLVPEPADTSAMLTIAGKRNYSRFDRIARRILFPKANLACKEADSDRNNEFAMQMRSTWEIYELWVFLTLAKIIHEIWPECLWSLYENKAHGFVFNFENNTTVVGKNDDLQVVLTYQREYRSYSPVDKQMDDYRSISKAFRPDFTLSVNRAGSKKLIIYDAKYRASRESIHEALREIHIYRDAIRNPVMEVQAEAVFIITPGAADDAAVYFKADYRHKFRFGGYVLSLQENSQREQLKQDILVYLDH